MSSEMKPAAPSTARGAASSRGERIATLGTVVSAILASSCCWVPLLLLGLGLLGVSTGGLARTLKGGLESYRTAFMAVTFAFLGLAFYFTYRPRRPATAKGGAEDCWQKTPKSGGRRFSMMTMNKVMLWIVAVMAVGFLCFPQQTMGLLLPGGDDEITADMATAVLRVEGMTWPKCVSDARQAIREAAPGVRVKVDDEKKLVTIGAAKDEPVPREKILDALESLGYSGQWVEE